MTANINTILIVGATSGLGEAFARYFHSKGKTVIAAGRRLERLDALKSELKGLETLQIDVENVQAIEPKPTETCQGLPRFGQHLCHIRQNRAWILQRPIIDQHQYHCLRDNHESHSPHRHCKGHHTASAVLEQANNFHHCNIRTGIHPSSIAPSV
jgi:hypothetical protein